MCSSIPPLLLLQLQFSLFSNMAHLHSFFDTSGNSRVYEEYTGNETLQSGYEYIVYLDDVRMVPVNIRNCASIYKAFSGMVPDGGIESLDGVRNIYPYFLKAYELLRTNSILERGKYFYKHNDFHDDSPFRKMVYKVWYCNGYI